nr:immunoglobulin light chain junction region [Macaca mulatta]
DYYRSSHPSSNTFVLF